MILASQSPRRREILSFFNLPFTQVSPDYDEEAVPFEGDPVEYVRVLSEGKALSIEKDDIIISADTIVYKNGLLYPKPKDEKMVKRFLSELVDSWHSVYTGVTVRRGDELFSQVEETRVLFNPLTPEQIGHYCNKIHWADKAGGYAIQMGGGLIVRKIDGCYYNVMGLPINTLHALLRKVDIELWEYVR